MYVLPLFDLDEGTWALREAYKRHFEAIALATSLPCVLYNIPGRTGVNLAVETVIRLAAIPNIVGIKEASGSLDAVSRIVEKR